MAGGQADRHQLLACEMECAPVYCCCCWFCLGAVQAPRGTLSKTSRTYHTFDTSQISIVVDQISTVGSRKILVIPVNSSGLMVRFKEGLQTFSFKAFMHIDIMPCGSCSSNQLVLTGAMPLIRFLSQCAHKLGKWQRIILRRSRSWASFVIKSPSSGQPKHVRLS